MNFLIFQFIYSNYFQFTTFFFIFICSIQSIEDYNFKIINILFFILRFQFQLNQAVYCIYLSTTTANCVAATACNLYTPTASSELASCQALYNASGKPCSWTSGANCREWDCYDISSPKSQVDCDVGNKNSAITCKYYNGNCYNKGLACASITTPSSNQSTFCSGVTGTDGKCTYKTGATTCTLLQTSCSSYSFTDISDCNALQNSNGVQCTFVTGAACTEIGVCSSYTPGTGSSECPLVKNVNGKVCGFIASASTCSEGCSLGDATTCTTISNLCFWSGTNCLLKGTCESYQNSQVSDCTKVQDSVGNYCKADSSTCATRTCADVTFYSQDACSNYSNLCKSNGKICVNKNSTSYECQDFTGSSSFCSYLIDSNTPSNNCVISSTAISSSGASCRERSCYDDVASTTDDQCNTFMTGCVTRGTGCIPGNTACSGYIGKKELCETFKQYVSTNTDGTIKYTYCSGSSTNTDYDKCKDRECTDNTTATSDSQCESYLSGCLTTGKGCISNTASCGSYSGTQATCQTFIGNSVRCYNTASATATTACIDRTCSLLSGSNNADCLTAYPKIKTTDSQKCIYGGGTSCVNNGQTCSYFTGTVDSCPLYIATDGPCTSSGVGTNSAKCTPRTCDNAPTTYTTDTQCQTWNINCYTTGAGCTKDSSCLGLSTSTACGTRATCTWTNQCLAAISNCSAYSNTSASQCKNATVNGANCAWVDSTTTCRAQTCADQPSTFTTHLACQAFSTTCTTTGAGCITISSLCSSYTDKTTCTSAAISQDGNSRCGWDAPSTCRNRICSDQTSGTTDSDCNTYLTGCVTNGTSCVTGNYCSEYSVNSAYCKSSKEGACLWRNNQCYKFTKCSDISGSTHTYCQNFSTSCTSDGTSCIAISTCASYTSSISCKIGTDGTCGILPSGSCALFTSCSAATGTTNTQCSDYSSTCVTDGTACIEKGACTSYLTPTACGNTGTDGKCYYSGSACRLAQCTDATLTDTTSITTVAGCNAFIVTGTTCTTNGTGCIAPTTCDQYTKDTCNGSINSSGEYCFYDTTTTTPACRAKTCADVSGTTNTACTSILLKSTCVTDSTKCIVKALCSSYTNKLSCNAGGTDGTCAFTPSATGSTTGTCKLFSACTDANNDQTACATNISCKWTSGTTTSCASQTCSTYNSGTVCKPVPNFAQTSYTICSLSGSTCNEADGSTLVASTCYSGSLYTYTWNVSSSACQSCVTSTNTTNNSNNSNNSGTTDSNQYIISALLPIGLLGFWI